MHGNQGIGQILGEFVEQTAREAGLQKLVTLSTQAFSFFSNKLGYNEGSAEDLPAVRREEHSSQGRNSKILTKQLTPQD